MRDKKGRFIKGHRVDKKTRLAVHRKTLERYKSGEKFGFQKEKENPSWKETGYGLATIHEWITKRKPKPLYCENCGEEKDLELSNRNHKYSRDPNDYDWFCRSCHRYYEYAKGLR